MRYARPKDAVIAAVPETIQRFRKQKRENEATSSISTSKRPNAVLEGEEEEEE